MRVVADVAGGEALGILCHRSSSGVPQQHITWSSNTCKTCRVVCRCVFKLTSFWMFWT